MNVDVNYLAVVLAMVSSMVVGSIWYSQAVFGKRWIKLAKIDMSKGNKKDVWKPIAMTAVASLLTAYILAHVTFLSHNYFNNSWLQDAVMTAFWLWLGLTAARIVTHDAFEGRPKELTLMTVSHELVTLLLMGLVIGVLHP